MWLPISAGLGALAVVCGAFGAHALKSRLTADQLSAWNTAVLYHLLHSVVILALALYAAHAAKPTTLPMWLFAAGIALFSGSIYLLVLTKQSWLGPVTPIGGLLLIAGWLSLWTLR